MIRRPGLILMFLSVTSMVMLAITPHVLAGTYNIRFDITFLSGDNVSRDFYIAVDGNNIAHDVFSGSGTLSTSVALGDNVGHLITAWPIINHDRSRYSGSLYVNGNVCAQSSDVWQASPLSCSIQPVNPNPTYVITFNSYFVSGDNVARDFYIEGDGATVSHGVFSGSGRLTSSPLALNYGSTHYIDAWPIINRDRSIYGGTLYVNGQLCGQSSDVHQNNRLTCIVQANGTVVAVPEFPIGSTLLILSTLLLAAAYLGRRRRTTVR